MTMASPNGRRLAARWIAGAAALILVGCTAEEGAREASGATEANGVCAQVAALEAGARRDNFVLDFAAAERKLRAVSATYSETPEVASCERAAGPAGALAELGLALSSQRKFRLAEAAFDEAEARLAAGDGGREERRVLDEGRIQAYRAQHDLNSARYAQAGARSDSAIRLLGLSTTAFGVEGGGELFGLEAAEYDRRMLGASSLYARAAALSRSGDVEAARGAIAAALRATEALPGATGAMRSRLLVEEAAVELSGGSADRAVSLASAAATQLAQEVPGTSLAARARLIEAVALAQSGRDAAAFEAFGLAFDTYSENPAELQYESIWPFIKLSVESRRAGRIDEETLTSGVFRAAQLVRTAAAAADIAQTAALFEAGDGEGATAIRDWRAVQEQVSLLSTALARRDLQVFQREPLERQLLAASQEEERLRERRDRLAPEYRAAIEAPITLAQVQGALKPGEALLQILVGTPRSTVLLVEPDRIRVRTTQVNRELVEFAVGTLRAAITPGPGGQVPAYPAALAHSVFQFLLEDLGPDVAAMPSLFVSATGPLQGIPLEMLVTEDPSEALADPSRPEYSGVAWLGAATRIAYLPAPRSLVDLRASAGRSRASKSFIGFGNFQPARDPAAGIDPRRREACGEEVAGLRGLGRLPGTERELDAIGAIFAGEGRVLSGAAFTESAVKDLARSGELADYRILHFATHGVLWPSVDCFEPALTASTPDAGSDGILETSEIRALGLDAELVVMSACDSVDPTASESGENLSGLTRAFLSSGARAAIASHWLVDDAVASTLMPDFYRRIAETPGLSFAEALSQAQGAVRADPARSHPVFWAPFVLFGDGGVGLGEG